MKYDNLKYTSLLCQLLKFSIRAEFLDTKWCACYDRNARWHLFRFCIIWKFIKIMHCSHSAHTTCLDTKSLLFNASEGFPNNNRYN